MAQDGWEMQLLLAHTAPLSAVCTHPTGPRGRHGLCMQFVTSRLLGLSPFSARSQDCTGGRRNIQEQNPKWKCDQKLYLKNIYIYLLKNNNFFGAVFCAEN